MSKKLIDAILLCGGKGTRFHEITQDKIPKSLYKLNGKELIKLTTDNLDLSLIDSLIFAVDHHADSLRNWVASQNFPNKIHFSCQTEPGILGAVNAAVGFTKQNSFVVCNTDELRDGISLKTALDSHYTNHSPATMLTAYSNNLYCHRVVNSDSSGIVNTTELKNLKYQQDKDLVMQINTGFIIFNKSCIDLFDDTYGNDWSSLIDPLVEKRLISTSLNSNIRYFNIGTKEELALAQSYLNDTYSLHDS